MNRGTSLGDGGVFSTAHSSRPPGPRLEFTWSVPRRENGAGKLRILATETLKFKLLFHEEERQEGADGDRVG